MKNTLVRLSSKSLLLVAFSIGLSGAAFGADAGSEKALSSEQANRFVRVVARLAAGNKTLNCTDAQSFKSDSEPQKNGTTTSDLALAELAKTGALAPDVRAQFHLVVDQERGEIVLSSFRSDVHGNSNAEFAQDIDESEAASFTMNLKMTELKAISFRSVDFFRSRFGAAKSWQRSEGKRTITCGAK